LCGERWNASRDVALASFALDYELRRLRDDARPKHDFNRVSERKANINPF